TTDAFLSVPARSIRASTITTPASRAVTGYVGMPATFADGVSSEGAATSFGGSPWVGPTTVGWRNVAATRTCDATATERGGPSGREGPRGPTPPAGGTPQPRPHRPPACGKGGGVRSAVTLSTRPPALTATSTSTSPPPTASCDSAGTPPDLYRAGVNGSC